MIPHSDVSGLNVYVRPSFFDGSTRNDIKLILLNTSDSAISIKRGDILIQMQILASEQKSKPDSEKTDDNISSFELAESFSTVVVKDLNLSNDSISYLHSVIQTQDPLSLQIEELNLNVILPLIKI